MDDPEATISFVCLLRYDQVVPTGQVLLAEATCASLFGTFDSEFYRNIRLEGLPNVRWEYGLNRSDPLRSLPTGPATIGNDATTYRRLRTLENCLNGGPIRVGFHSRRGHTSNGSYQFCLFNENFTIPKDVALSWKLGKESEINVQWQCTLDRHPHAFAPLAEEDDVGKGVGIKAFKLVDGVVHEHWIVRKSREAVLLANTLYDFLNDQIVGKEYEWTESRRYIFQENEKEVHKDTGSERTGRRKHVGIPYFNEDFKWNDGLRQPETKPTSRNKILPSRGISPASEDAQKANSGVDREETDPLRTNTMQTQAVPLMDSMGHGYGDNRQDQHGTNSGSKRVIEDGRVISLPEIIDWTAEENDFEVDYEDWILPMHRKYLYSDHFELKSQGHVICRIRQ